jgi:hypothetical protein
VAACQQAEQRPLDEAVLSDDDPPDLRQRGIDDLVVRPAVRCRGGLGGGHRFS